MDTVSQENVENTLENIPYKKDSGAGPGTCDIEIREKRL